MTHILIFGDSITYGKWDIKGGWAQRLNSFVDEKALSDPNYDCSVYNLGVSGDTIPDLLERVEPETYARVDEEKIILVFAIGVNDSQILKQGPRFSLKEFRENLNKLVEKSRKFSSKIIFIGLTPVDDSKVNPMPWASEKSYKNENVKKFDKELKDFCKEQKLDFIEIFEKLSENYKELLEDGAHPNTKGHEEMFVIIKDFLEEKKVI